MNRIWDLIVNNDSVEGKLVTTAVIATIAILVAPVIGRVLARRAKDRYRKYYVRKSANYAVGVIAIIAMGILWRPFAGQLGLVLGLITAGLAFAMQELIGALAGWFNIVSGSIYRVGDRVQVGGVRGDVIDVTPLRTKVMEIGSAADPESWVKGRQYTGRVVAISNKSTFTDPVYNYSAAFEFIWDEVTIPVAYNQDWRQAERILHEEALAISALAEAKEALADMLRRYPVERTEIEPRVFARATDNYLELSARFILPVRESRMRRDQITRRVLDRFEEAGIEVASTTADIRLVAPPPRPDDLDRDDGGGRGTGSGTTD